MTDAMQPQKSSQSLVRITSFWLSIAGAMVVGCSGVAPSNNCGTSVGGGTSPCVSTGGATSTTGGTRSTGGSSAQGGAKNAGGTASATGGATSSTAGTTGAHTNPLSQDLINQFVTAHNNARSGPLNPTPSPALPPVSWDYTLADSAYNYLSQCPGGNVSLAPHNANRTTDYQALGGTDSYVGENIYAFNGFDRHTGRCGQFVDERSVFVRLHHEQHLRCGTLHASRLARQCPYRLRNRQLHELHVSQHDTLRLCAGREYHESKAILIDYFWGRDGTWTRGTSCRSTPGP